jgi:restriction system protein
VNWSLPKNSLFAILLRSPWWKSLGVALILALVAAALLPDRLKLAGALASFPFVVIGLIAAWRQLKQPSASAIERTAHGVRDLDWAQFRGLIEAALSRNGYVVERSKIEGVDFETFKEGRRALILARRWKSAHIGIEALRALRQAADQADCQDAVFVGLGEPSEAAAKFADSSRVDLWQASRLAALGVLPR